MVGGGGGRWLEAVWWVCGGGWGVAVWWVGVMGVMGVVGVVGGGSALGCGEARQIRHHSFLDNFSTDFSTDLSAPCHPAHVV